MISSPPKEFINAENDPHFASTAFWNALVVIITFILGVNIFDYQAEILRVCMYYKRVAVVASRQIGKSVCIALLALAWALSRPNQMILIISTGERQVKELLTKRNYSIKKIFKRAGKNVDPKSMIKAVGQVSGMKLEFTLTTENAEEIEFANGSRIVVIPANPDTAAGYTADLLIGDEIAKISNWPEMAAACFPATSRVDGTIALFSSYKGKNHWYEITQDKLSPENPKGWLTLLYDIFVNPPPDIEQLRHDFPEEVFNEEYLCIPMDEAHSLFPYSLFDKCATGDFAEWN